MFAGGHTAANYNGDLTMGCIEVVDVDQWRDADAAPFP